MQVELYILLSSGDEEEKEGNIYLNWVICLGNIQTTQIFPYCYSDHLFQYTLLELMMDRELHLLFGIFL